MSARLSYALITPARDERENLDRLCRSLVAQEFRPREWVIVDNGSIDGTAEYAAKLAELHPWISSLSIDAVVGETRAEPTIRAFEAGLALLGERDDVIVKLDADVSFEPDFFSRLVGAFERDPLLGMASGSCYELQSGVWRQRHVTGGHVWGATRAYRRSCLDAILPLDYGLAWDGIDELKAAVDGWRAETLTDLAFRHHRPEGERETSQWNAWVSTGRMSYYMGYRFGYFVLRTLYHARRNPAALLSILGFVSSGFARAPRYPDDAVLAHLRRKQSLRNVPLRIAEAFGRASYPNR